MSTKINDSEIKSKFTRFIKRKIGKMEVEVGVLPAEVPEIEVDYIETDNKGIRKIIFTPKDIQEDIKYGAKHEFEDENIVVYTDPLNRYIREIHIKKPNIHEVKISIVQLEKKIEEDLEKIDSRTLEGLKEARYLDYKDRQLKIVEDILER